MKTLVCNFGALQNSFFFKDNGDVLTSYHFKVNTPDHNYYYKYKSLKAFDEMQIIA
jgi:hypothetical protein